MTFKEISSRISDPGGSRLSEINGILGELASRMETITGASVDIQGVTPIRPRMNRQLENVIALHDPAAPDRIEISESMLREGTPEILIDYTFHEMAHAVDQAVEGSYDELKAELNSYAGFRELDFSDELLLIEGLQESTAYFASAYNRVMDGPADAQLGKFVEALSEGNTREKKVILEIESVISDLLFTNELHSGELIGEIVKTAEGVVADFGVENCASMLARYIGKAFAAYAYISAKMPSDAYRLLVNTRVKFVDETVKELDAKKGVVFGRIDALLSEISPLLRDCEDGN